MMPEDVGKAVARIDESVHINPPRHTIFVGDKTDWQTIRAHLLAREAEVDRLRDMLRQVHKDYGCEIRDPCGTIWEHAAKVEKQAERAEALLRDIKSWDIGGSLGPKRTAMLALPINLRARITAHLSENSRG